MKLSAVPGVRFSDTPAIYSVKRHAQVEFSATLPGASAFGHVPHPDLVVALKPYDDILELPVLSFAQKLLEQVNAKTRAFQEAVLGQNLPNFVQARHGLLAALRQPSSSELLEPFTSRGSFKTTGPVSLGSVPVLKNLDAWRWQVSSMPKGKSPHQPDESRSLIIQELKGNAGTERYSFLSSLVPVGRVDKQGVRYKLRLNQVPVQRGEPRMSDPKIQRSFRLDTRIGVAKNAVAYWATKMLVPATAQYSGVNLFMLQKGTKVDNPGVFQTNIIRVSVLPALARRLRLGEPSITPAKPKKVVVYDGPMFEVKKS